MNRVPLLLGAAALALASFAIESRAEACGGCFHPQEAPSIVTDHRMVFSVSKTQSTLYDQIRYTGAPESFAWVLPYVGDPNNGEIVVGVSADILFSALDALTETQIFAPQINCPPPPSCGSSSSGASGTSGSSGTGGTGVNVLKREVVGPYETVHIKANDAKSLQVWLDENGYAIAPDVGQIITQYQNANTNFLVVKLVPGENVQDMRPIRVTTKGANVQLPLKMVAAGAGANLGIALWVVGEGRYEPQNFPNFIVRTDELVWDFAANVSNYRELRAAKTQAGNGRAWEIESSVLVQRNEVESVILRGSSTGAGPAPITEEDRAQVDYLPRKNGDVVVQTATQVRAEDLATLFYGIGTATSRVTRLRADLARSALTADLGLTASADQSILPRTRQVTKSVNAPTCPTFPECGASSSGGASSGASGSASSGSAGVAPSSSASTFTCGASPARNDAWLGVGVGLIAIAGGQLVRRRRRGS